MARRDARAPQVSLWYAAVAACLAMIVGGLVLSALATGAVGSEDASRCRNASLSQTSVPAACVRNATTLIHATNNRVATRFLWADNLFIPIYLAWLTFTALASICTAFGGRFKLASRTAATLSVGISVAAAISDYVENARALHALARQTQTPWVALRIAEATTLKWQLLGWSLVIVVLLAIMAAAASVITRFRS